MHRRRALGIALAVVCLVWPLSPTTVMAAAPDVREITPAGITIDGSAGDWDEPGADFLANMFEAGNPDKPVLSRLYGRYDCSTETFYVFVETVHGWLILPSDNDNYVKLGQEDKLVDGSAGSNGSPPDFAYVGATGWEAAFHLAPGSYLGDNGLNVHAEVVPEARPATSAVANRRLDVTIDCTTPPPTPTPTPTPTPAPTPTPTPVPTPTPTPCRPRRPHLFRRPSPRRLRRRGQARPRRPLRCRPRRQLRCPLRYRPRCPRLFRPRRPPPCRPPPRRRCRRPLRCRLPPRSRHPHRCRHPHRSRHRRRRSIRRSSSRR